MKICYGQPDYIDITIATTKTTASTATVLEKLHNCYRTCDIIDM